MRRSLILSFVLASASVSPAYESRPVATNDYAGVRIEVNYSEGRVAPYVLEDPLTFADGRKVRTAVDWRLRRQEILDLFAREMFGREPPAPEGLTVEKVGEKVTCAGFAIRRLYRMRFRADGTGPCVNWVVWLPRWAKGTSPVILFLNYHGNHELANDPDIPMMTAWCRNDDWTKEHRALESMRGIQRNENQDSVFPLDMILARGFAVMSACYCEVSPDPDWDEPPPHDPQTFAYTGVFDLWGKRDASRTDDITSIGAWAWALSRGLDLAERIPGIDAKKSVVTGCSRLGKSALLAAARDLGARSFFAFRKIFMPGIRRGIISAILMVFIPAIGSYVIPDLVGGTDSELIGNKIYQRTFPDRNLPHASALATITGASVLIPLACVAWWLKRQDEREAKRLAEATARKLSGGAA